MKKQMCQNCLNGNPNKIHICNCEHINREETKQYYKLKKKPLNKYWRGFKKRYGALIKALGNK